MSPAFRVVLLLSALLGAALALAFADLTPRYDEVEFLELGRRIAAGGEPHLFRAPGYQVFVALGLKLAGGKPVGVRLLQVLLAAGTALLVYRCARRIAGERAGFAAGTFTAFYPSFLAYSHLLWAETLFVFLVMAAFDRLLAADERGCWRTAAFAGLLLGVAALVRSMGVALLVASAIWMLARRADRARLTAAVVGAAAVVLLPWALSASGRAGRFVLVDANGGYNLFSGHNRHIPAGLQGIWSLGLPLHNGTEEARAAQLAAKRMNPRAALLRPEGDWRAVVATEMAAAGIRDAGSFEAADWYAARAREAIARDPLGALGRVPLKLAAWWAPDFFLPRHLWRDWYGPVPPPLATGLVLLTWIAAAVPLLLGPAALAARAGSRFRSLALAWLGIAAILHGVLFGVSRMHLPYVPLLVIAVAVFAFDREEVPGLGRAVRRGAPWMALALAAWIVSAPVVAGLYIAPGPRHVVAARVLGTLGETPLPGGRHATWMRAEVVAAAGDPVEAARTLRASRHGEVPWSLVVRALISPDAGATEVLLERAFTADPALGASLSGLLEGTW